MNPKFKEWVVKKHEKLTGEDKKAFLRILKQDPSLMLENIRASFYQWVAEAWDQEKITAHNYDLNKHVKEILVELQTHFAKELEVVT